MDAYLVCECRIFSSFNRRRPCGRQTHTDRSKQERRFDLSKAKASIRGFEAEPKLEETNPFGELAVASLVLSRVKPAIVEGPAPLLPVVSRRNDEARVGPSTRARQTEQTREQVGGITVTLLDPETTVGANRRPCRVGGADRFRNLQP